MWHEERLLIDGELVDATDTFPTIDPTTGEPLGTASDAGTADADRAVAAARRAFDTTGWAQDHAFRSRCLRQLHEALTSHSDEMRALLVAEVGAPIALTDGPQFATPVGMVEWYADQLDKYEFTTDLGMVEAHGGEHHRWVEKEPAGVVASIVPYNYPVQITLAKLAPAIAAGCTSVIKAPPETPWVSASLGRLIAEHTDIPAGVVNVLTSSTGEVGEALVSDPRVDMVSFTGSTATGRRIMATASHTIKKCFLELGGKSALIVLDDADQALASMIAAFTICSHAGQGCAITSRLLVPASQHDAIVAQVAEMLAGIPVGDPSDPATYMGPLISERQRDKVAGYVTGAVAEGATVAVGGSRPEALPRGFFFEPTLLTGVDPHAAVAQEEVFGPVLVVLPYADDDDAVRIADDTIFGLSAGVFGADQERATAMARRLRSGTVSVNGGFYYGADAPFGGYKQSGIGREMGLAGLEEFLEMKTIAAPAG